MANAWQEVKDTWNYQAKPKLAAMSMGAMNVPIDFSRYTQLIGNGIYGGLVNDPVGSQLRANEINKVHDSPPVLGDAFNAYRQGIMNDNPDHAIAGEVLFPGLVAAQLSKLNKIKNISGPIIQYINPFNGAITGSKAAQFARGATIGAANEGIKEPLQNFVLNDGDIIRNDPTPTYIDWQKQNK